jgi:hypothetical protein
MKRILSTFLFFLLLNCARAQGDLPIYTDEFDSGFVPYGWATVCDPHNASPVHQGTHSLRLSCKAFEGEQFHHSPLQSQLYTSLTFWVYGDAKNPQMLQVAGYLRGNIQSAVNLPRLKPGWQQITVSLAQLGVDHKSSLDGFFRRHGGGGPHARLFCR